VFESAIFCLALNVYFEARNEPAEGKVAVAQVVMNRKADPRFPDTI
jgi:spore germination cell wall hydrolase CwlJ-like protein